MVNRAQPDYAGFVFAPGRRQVTAEQAENLRRQLDPAIAAVGVFVKAPVEEAAALANRGTIQLIQLHGEEDEDYVKALRWRTQAPIIRVIRVRGPESLRDLDRYDCDYFLLDTYSGSQFGGLGKTFDHSLIRQARFPRPFFLAGDWIRTMWRRPLLKAAPSGWIPAAASKLPERKMKTKSALL